MYYVYMLWCRDDTLYTGTASDLCRRMRQHRDGGAACAQWEDALTGACYRLTAAGGADREAIGELAVMLLPCA